MLKRVSFIRLEFLWFANSKNICWISVMLLLFYKSVSDLMMDTLLGKGVLNSVSMNVIMVI